MFKIMANLYRKKLPFKKVYIKKLKQLGVLDRFVRNYYASNWRNTHRHSRICLNSPNWYGFIDFCFNWVSTPEGYDFWYEIKYWPFWGEKYVE